ncbi:hypothetical protein AMS68_006063 [Peltaster fructicola]|uniref:Dienelactone hydrolase domain-containing protein n=1 Tax=Peltaster fructicola TaxID=286661 RepID=A0A6H0Y0T9_9PEZI|nr:hypothetical protein AMS68_006063 [Peltaster fructicola]
MSIQSHACCTVPAVVDHDYKEKGEYVTIAGTKVYATGPADATKAILVIYDIFGYFPQTMQGADILAYGDKEQSYRVYMPDFFDGEPADVAWYPPQTDEHKEKLGKFFETKAAPPKSIERAGKIIDEIQSKKNIKEWGVFGLCWGGKVANLLSGKDTRFKAGAAAHPAMVDPEDAKNITIPFGLLPSKDEPKEDVEKWEKAIKTPHFVEWYPTQVHGFMGARAELKDSSVKAEYEKGYKHLLNWFHEHL